MNCRLLINLSLAYLGITISLYSQEAAGVTIRLRLLAFGSEQQLEKVFIHDPSGPLDAPALSSEIKSYLNHESITINCKGAKLAVTLQAERKSIADPQTLVAEVTLPAKVRSAILLFLPGKAGDRARSRVMLINDNVDLFPAGSYMVTNLSPQLVRLELEKKPFEFKPSSSSLIVDPPVRSNRHSGMRAFAFCNNEWLPIASGLWPHPGKARSLLVLFPNPTTGTVNLRAFGDVPPRAPVALADGKP